jgi:hypothetical protein
MQLRTLHPKSYLWLCLLLTLLFATWAQWPWLTDPYAIEEDFRNMYWVHRYEDPSLYPNVDFSRLGVTEYVIGPWQLIIENASPGYSLLMQIGSQMFSPILFHKLLVFPLALIAAFYMFHIGEQLSNSKTALVLSLVFIVLNLATHTEVSVIGGLHRSFVMPLILAFAYYLMTNRHWVAALVIFIAGIVYAPIFPVLCITYALSAVQFRENGRWRIKITWFALWPLAAAMLLVVLAISPTPLPVHEQTSETSEPVHILQDPAYQPGGRRPLFILFPLVGRGGIASSGETAIPILVLLILSLATYIILRERAIPLPPTLRNLLIASLIGFSLAWLAIIFMSSFLLYIPNRHTQSTFFLVPLIYVFVNARQTLRTGATLLVQNKKHLAIIIVPVLIVTIGLSIIYPYTTFISSPDRQNPLIPVLLIGLSILLVTLTIIVQRRQEKKNDLLPAVPVSLGTVPQVTLAVILFLGALLYIHSFQAVFYTPSTQGNMLNAFVETLPKDAHISGHPCLLDDIPFYAKRSVLFSCERFKFLENEQKVVMDALMAYYTEDETTVLNFCQQYNIDFLIVNENSFISHVIQQERFFYEPYNELLIPIIQTRSTFALSQIADDNKLFQVGSVFVVACDPNLLR